MTPQIRARTSTDDGDRLIAPKASSCLKVDVSALRDLTCPICDRQALKGKLGAILSPNQPETDLLVKLDHFTRSDAHGTILAMGISTRSVAPASDNAGISRLICDFGTTVSTA